MSVRRITDRAGPSLSPLATALQTAVSSGVTPGAQACVISRGKLVHRSAHGHARLGGEKVTPSTLFDVASVTKLAATTAAAYVLLSRRMLGLDDAVVRYLPSFGRNGKRAVTVRHLLAHQSGLPAWLPLFEGSRNDATASAIWPGGGGAPRGRATAPLFRAFERSRALVVDAVLSAPLVRPPGSACVYSDLGFIALGELLATVAGCSLDRLCDRELFGALELTDTAFFDHARPEGPAFPAGRVLAATGLTRPREPAPGQEGLFVVPPQEPVARPGEVDDDNAYAMAGVAGHAGLFSTADDLARLGVVILEDAAGASVLGHASMLSQLLAPGHAPEGPTRGLGFDLPAPVGSAAGTKLGHAGPLGAAGHLGFTGCSLWIDRDRELSVALLTNRVHPGRAAVEGIRALRPAFHDLVVDTLEERS